MKIIFAGTPEFAAIHLQALIASEHDVVAVLTQPDRPAGRGRKIAKSAVKEVAEAHQLNIHQPLSLKNNQDIETILAQYNADIMVVVAYGLILPENILQLPTNGCVNVHASLLPRWRGSAPIHRAIESGDSDSGISIMQMDKGLDTGDVLQMDSIAITMEDNLQSLHDKLAKLGCQALLNTLSNYHSITAQPQDNNLANYAEKISKEETTINWQDISKIIHDKIRGFCPWPVATTKHNGVLLRIWQAELGIVNELEDQNKTQCGEIIAINKTAIVVKTGDGIIHLKSIQKPGSKAMQIADFTNGYPIQVGDIFGQ